MAESISERAHQYGCKVAGGWYEGGIRGSVYEAHRDAYIEIATSQHKIDTEKACEWLKKHVRSAYIDMGKCGLSECHAQEWWLEEFCKAMEEE